MNDGAIKSSMRHLSMLGAWALAFGCAVGSDAFVMPWNDFLPKAGPLGTVIGIFIGGLVMAVVAWNFHYMINRQPGPGGSYAYAAKAFGNDHGYLCGVFLGFAYFAIICLDVTALVVVARYMLGDVFSFGFRYTIAKSDIYLGDILLSVFAIAVAAAICCRRRLSGIVQTAMAVVFAAGILVCFASTTLNHSGGLGAMCPIFAPDRGHGLFQVLSILAIAPWLFVCLLTTLLTAIYLHNPFCSSEFLHGSSRASPVWGGLPVCWLCVRVGSRSRRARGSGGPGRTENGLFLSVQLLHLLRRWMPR